MKYQVTLIEIIRHTIEVRAKDEESALEAARAKYETKPEKFESEEEWDEEIEELE